MGFMDELKKLTRPYDDDGDLVDGGEDMDLEPEDEPVYTRPTPAADPVVGGMDSGAAGAGLGADLGGLGGFGSLGDIPKTSPEPIHMGGSAASGASKYRVVLVKPDKFDMATPIAKQILQGNTVILNCEETDELAARRIIDFLSGCTYALEGSIKKASNDVFIFAPKDVGVDDAKEEEQLEG